MKTKVLTSLLIAVGFHSLSHATFVVEKALIQEEEIKTLFETDDFTLYRIAQQPTKGFHWPYLLLIGKNLNSEETSTIYVETVNTGTSSNSYRFHEERGLSALETLFYNLKQFEKKMIFVMPVFLRPKDNWKLYTHALDRDSILIEDPIFKRLDLQVLAMVTDAKSILGRKGFEVKEKFAIGGFSASGEFAQRFSVFHPESLSFVIAGGFGGLPVLPINEKDGKVLRYPVGISDIEEISGASFQEAEFLKLHRFLYYGSEDNNDPVKYNDAYDEEDRDIIFEVLGREPPERWLESIKVYKGISSASELYVDQGMGHRTSKQMAQKINEFITRQLK